MLTPSPPVASAHWLRLLTTGGTIAAVAEAPATAVGGPTLTGAQILARVPPVAGLDRLEVVDVMNVFSHAFGLEHVQDLCRAVLAAIADGVDAIVVSHGTDTVEESAYALALMVPRGVPLIFTGSIRPASHAAADGAANLSDALRVALAPAAARLGPLVVMANEIHTARWVTKVHSTNMAAFGSPGAGPVGEVCEGHVHVWFEPTYHDFVGTPEFDLARLSVPLVRLPVGAETEVLGAVLDSRPDAVVLEAPGGGHVRPELVACIDAAAAAHIPLVMCARSPIPRTLMDGYSGRGTSKDLLTRGVIPAGGISGLKARLRLIVGLALGRPPASLFPVS